MKTSDKTKNSLKYSAKVLSTIIAVNATLTFGIIVAAVLSEKPKYNKTAHSEAQHTYDAACDAYKATYKAAMRDAKSSIHMNSKNWPFLSEMLAAEVAAENCDDSARCDELKARYDSLRAEFDNRINDKMNRHDGLILATNAMNDAFTVLDKYEQDKIAYDEWKNQPLGRRINNSLQKIFLNEQQRIARRQRLFKEKVKIH